MIAQMLQRKDATVRTRLVRGMLAAAVALVVSMPAGGRGDTVRLKDGVITEGKSPVAGGRHAGSSHLVRCRRARCRARPIAMIAFTDSLGGPAPPPTVQPGVPGAGTTGGVGTIAVSFRDRKISSKVVVVRGHERDERLHANWIEQALIVDDVVVYSRGRHHDG